MSSSVPRITVAGLATVGLCGFLAPPLAAESTPPPVWVTSLQTGMADTFQLTLGGMFGEGPAWQNKLTTGVSNAFRAGDSLSVYAWDTVDARSNVNNWQAGLGYKVRVLKKKNHVLALGSGVQRWLFPSVKSGAKDWLVPGNLSYQTKLYKFPFLVTSDSWTVVSSPLPLGSLLHTQTWLQHKILKRDRVQITFKHGPAHTYSWGFWGTNGNRIFRYQTMLAINFKDTSIEGGYRKQVGLQDGIQNNNYWQFAVTRTFTRPWSAR
jgi:hypothetical protein